MVESAVFLHRNDLIDQLVSPAYYKLFFLPEMLITANYICNQNSTTRYNLTFLKRKGQNHI